MLTALPSQQLTGPSPENSHLSRALGCGVLGLTGLSPAGSDLSQPTDHRLPDLDSAPLKAEWAELGRGVSTLALEAGQNPLPVLSKAHSPVCVSLRPAPSQVS